MPDNFDPFPTLTSFSGRRIEPGHAMSCLLIGDNWVAAATATEDEDGNPIPGRVRRVFFEALPGRAPDLGVLENAVRRCWTGVGGAALEAGGRCAVCLPARGTVCRSASARVFTGVGEGEQRGLGLAGVHHVRELRRRVGREGLWPRYAVADLIPLT